MDFVQLDLFDIAERNELAEKAADNPKSVDELVLGDIIHVIWNNGVEFEGVFTPLRGHHNTREPSLAENYWVKASRVKGTRGEQWRDADRWMHFLPACSSPRYLLDEWYLVGHDDSFRLPDPGEILPRLIQELRQSPMQHRVNVYYSFANDYPQYSTEYYEVIHKAWEIASAEVTTLDELLSAEKGWSHKAKIPKDVAEHIERNIFPGDHSRWLDELANLRWSEYAWKDMHGRDNYSVYRFPRKGQTMWRHAFERRVIECRTPQELLVIMSMWGVDETITDGEKPPKFWIEEES